MRVSQLLAIFSELRWGDSPNSEVTAICSDSRQLQPGCVFVAIRGAKADGHQFLDKAAEVAIALVVEETRLVPADYRGAVVVVGDTRAALSQLGHRFFSRPSGSLFMVGVTGTNGKTTSTHLIESILQEFGWPSGVMGTIDHHLGAHVWPSEMTSPDPILFHRRLSEFVTLGAQAATIEVSSHALDQRRMDEAEFDCAVFTNLTRDHLDYHDSIESYFKAKHRLFSELLKGSTKNAKRAIINIDDPYGARLINDVDVPAWSIGASEAADFYFKVHSMDFSGSRFRLRTPVGELEFSIPMPGLYNVYNAVGAIAVGLAAGASLQTCARGLSRTAGVKGRLQSVPNSKGLYIFVDYAHTDDALKNVLLNLKQIRRDAGLVSKIWTVFGCGGDRDKGKRPLMMSVALEHSDHVYVTSDNPRSEGPEDIIADILRGAPQELVQSKVHIEADRRIAIHLALRAAKPGDVVLIAGKGHEDYQIIGHEKRHFSDVETVEEFFK